MSEESPRVLIVFRRNVSPTHALTRKRAKQREGQLFTGPPLVIRISLRFEPSLGGRSQSSGLRANRMAASRTSSPKRLWRLPLFASHQ